MRYAKLEYPLTQLQDLLLISKDKLTLDITRVTDLPDDAHIVGAEYDSMRQSICFLVAGSGAELLKVPDGGEVPRISIAIRDNRVP